jgi:HJR/Mrr/RecB family endonuclease
VDRAKSLLQLRREYDDHKIHTDKLRKLFNDRKTRLLLIDWRSLRGIPFELFLRDVFEVLEFATEPTKASGDQGVDLIATRSSQRIAFQAKGYEASVGTAAVQEAFAGMAFYKCHRCVVITNSKFTSGAQELAAATGCILIDGTMIPDLIAGKII